MKAPNIINYLTNLCHEYEEQGLDGFGVVLSDLLPGDSLSISLIDDIGVEDYTDIEGSYIDELNDVDHSYIDEKTRDGDKVLEAIIPMGNDTLVIYFFGADEQSVLDDLKQRYEDLGRGDI
jgi:hypothetical protein